MRRSIVNADTESLRTVRVALELCHHFFHNLIASRMAKASNVCCDLCEPISHFRIATYSEVVVSCMYSLIVDPIMR